MIYDKSMRIINFLFNKSIEQIKLYNITKEILVVKHFNPEYDNN